LKDAVYRLVNIGEKGRVARQSVIGGQESFKLGGLTEPAIKKELIYYRREA
jgi:hypothetical protein